MQIPETIKILPDHCIIVSYDCESNSFDKYPIIPGSIMSLGAVFAHWGRNYPPFDTSYGLPQLFFRPMTPQVPMAEKSKTFWKDHPEVLNWSTCDDLMIETAFVLFIRWLADIAQVAKKPIVLLSAPHAYDSQHLMHGFKSVGRAVDDIVSTFLWADAAELYATKHGLDFAEGKTEFKSLFMPKTLIHEPVMDSMDQLTATLKGLLYQRPAT